MSIFGIDGFKKINERLGHDVGDLVLKKIGNMLTRSLRGSDLIVRFTSDTFVLTICKLPVNREKTREIIEKIVAQIFARLDESIRIKHSEVKLTISGGTTFYPLDTEVIDDMFLYANLALKHAKKHHRGSNSFFEPSMASASTTHQKMESSLEGALQRQEFYLCYQPKTTIKTKQTCGVETLLRWNNMELGQVSPAQFVPILEDTGQIVEIGRWIIERACADFAHWQMQMLGIDSVAINLSALQFDDEKLLTIIADTLSRHNMRPEQLELEITESLLMKDIAKTRDMLNAFKEIGIKLSIDDFGTGYSSLSYLKQFPIDNLKIDQSFVKDLLTDEGSKTIVKSILQLARGLGLKTIAEGVEYREQWDYLGELGCDVVQGYYISKPQTCAALIESCKQSLSS